MKLNTNFIKAQFQNIEQLYHLKWITVRDHYMTLEDDKIRLMIGSDRWEEGVTLSFTNKAKNEFYYPWDLDVKNGFPENEDKHLNEQEQNYMFTITDDEKSIYSFRIMLERYCPEALRGDFSKLGKGRKDRIAGS